MCEVREMERTGSAQRLIVKAEENFQPASYHRLMRQVWKVVREAARRMIRGADVEEGLRRLAGERDG